MDNVGNNTNGCCMDKKNGDTKVPRMGKVECNTKKMSMDKFDYNTK